MAPFVADVVGQLGGGFEYALFQLSAHEFDKIILLKALTEIIAFDSKAFRKGLVLCGLDRQFGLRYSMRRIAEDGLKQYFGFNIKIGIRGYTVNETLGKYQLERLLAHRTKQMENEEYTLKDFFTEFNEVGSVPIGLVHWQLTGDDSAIREIMAAE